MHLLYYCVVLWLVVTAVRIVLWKCFFDKAFDFCDWSFIRGEEGSSSLDS